MRRKDESGSAIGGEASHERETRIVVVSRQRESEDQKSLRKKIATEAVRLGLPILKTIRVEDHRVVGGEEKDRLFPLLKPEDARWLYSKLHEFEIAVLAVNQAYVRRDPSTLPARKKQLISVERFIRYKGYWGLVRNARDVSEHLQEFRRSAEKIRCDGYDDARILPLHIFYCSQEWAHLDDPTEQQRFISEHGQSGKRTDCAGAYWTKPKGQAARHGGLALCVGGYQLQQGFHWDVSADSEVTVYFPDEVWKLRRRGYLNIYPDGHLRVVAKNPGSRRVWPRK